jgi:hypothetical protein
MGKFVAVKQVPGTCRSSVGFWRRRSTPSISGGAEVRAGAARLRQRRAAAGIRRHDHRHGIREREEAILPAGRRHAGGHQAEAGGARARDQDAEGDGGPGAKQFPEIKRPKEEGDAAHLIRKRGRRRSRSKKAGNRSSQAGDKITVGGRRARDVAVDGLRRLATLRHGGKFVPDERAASTRKSRTRTTAFRSPTRASRTPAR